MRKRINCKKTPVASTNNGEVILETKQHRNREMLYHFQNLTQLCSISIFERNLIQEIKNFKLKRTKHENIKILFS